MLLAFVPGGPRAYSLGRSNLLKGAPSATWKMSKAGTTSARLFLAKSCRKQMCSKTCATALPECSRLQKKGSLPRTSDVDGCNPSVATVQFRSYTEWHDNWGAESRPTVRRKETGRDVASTPRQDDHSPLRLLHMHHAYIDSLVVAMREPKSQFSGRHHANKHGTPCLGFTCDCGVADAPTRYKVAKLLL
ncbi:hypothetical protein BDY21DRAFT_351130 [Lineolata rhizophorae]|uniref:Uncharacterized protein n=1 Tax=Lineolata rhizophorae TaxID=578093 RepID=A0A6A6NUZ6_9PEZI|nr:hypothetical protein BDY21DRAFT_351130 [Lineolata rhizophorae]